MPIIYFELSQNSTNIRAFSLQDPDGISQTGNATPPPSAESPSNQELPYNLCKPITDQVKEGQSGQAILGVEQVLDLSSYGSSANGSRKAGGSGSSASDGTGSRAGSAELTLCPQGYSQTLLSTLQADGISKTSPRGKSDLNSFFLPTI